jgi:hypothetical protein
MLYFSAFKNGIQMLSLDVKLILTERHQDTTNKGLLNLLFCAGKLRKILTAYGQHEFKTNKTNNK